jgi:hypothetical protein
MLNKLDAYRATWRSYKSVAEEGHELHVRRANDVIRQLAFAGIAVVWVFRETTVAGQISLAPALRWAAAFLIITLTLDLLHYLVGAFQFGSCLDAIEQQVNKAIREGKEWPDNPDGPPPPLPEKIVKSFFCVKAIAVIVGAGLLLFYLAFRI